MRKILKIAFVFIISILSIHPVNTFGQTDTEFWFVAPEVSKNANGSTIDFLDSPVAFRITAYTSAANVTIDQPANSSFSPILISVPAGGTVSQSMNSVLSLIENKPANSVLSKGIRITSTAPVTIYYEVISSHINFNSYIMVNPEIFVLKGKNALGTNFLIPSQNLLMNDGVRFNPQPYSAFDIVATQNNTVVSITPSNDVVGHTAVAGTYTITLNQGETYSATASSQAASLHLGGSKVTSNKPIAITVKDDLVLGNSPYSGGGGDLGGDQITPVSLLGTDYIAMNGQLNGPGDYVFITAVQNATTVTKNGITSYGSLNAGQTVQVPVGGGNTSAYIQTSQPAIAWQLSGIGSEIGLTQLPQINCTGSQSVSYVRSTAEQLYLSLFTKNGNQANFSINGVPQSSSLFTSVPGTSNQWYAAKISLPLGTYPQGSVIKVSNSTGIFHMSTLDGGNSSGASFGYFSNYGSINKATSVSLCTGNTYNFGGVTLSSAGIYTDTFQTSLGCDSIVTLTLSYLPTYQNTRSVRLCTGNTYNFGGTILNTSGTYSHTFQSSQGCDSMVTLNLSYLPILQTTQNIQLCAGSTYNFSGTILSVAGVYSHTFQSSQGCDSIVTLNLSYLPILKTTQNIQLCTGNTYNFGGVILNSAGTYKDTFQTGSGCDSEVTLTLLYLPTYQLSQNIKICPGTSYNFDGTLLTSPGTYSRVYRTVQNCDSSVTLNLSFLGSLGDTLRISTCTDSFIVFGGNRITSSGIYQHTFMSKQGCDSPIVLIYKKGIIPEALFYSTPDYIANNIPFEFTNTSQHAVRYSWNFGDGNVSTDIDASHQYLKPGVYQVCLTAWSNDNCISTICQDVKAGDNMNADVPTAFSPNGDGKNDLLYVKGNGIKSFSFTVYNRWGQKVFETTDLNKGWDGSYQGMLQENDVVGYMLNVVFVDGSNFTKNGSITIIR